MSQENAAVQAFTPTENVINYNLDPRFASLVGGTKFPVADELQKLDELETRLVSGDCGNFSYVTIQALTRLRLSLALTAYGPESREVRAILSDMFFNFYSASKYEGSNQWAQVVQCFQMLDEDPEAIRHRTEIVEEARQHLGLAS